MKVKKQGIFSEMKSELDIINFVGHDYLLSASALQIDDNLFQSQFNILGKTQSNYCVMKISLSSSLSTAN